MLNSSWRLIGSWVFPFSLTFFFVLIGSPVGPVNKTFPTRRLLWKKAFFHSTYIWVMCSEVGKDKNILSPAFHKWLGQLLPRLPTLRNAAPKMSGFASISMQTAGQPFPEVKITASVCTKSHLEPRQTPLIWRLLAPTSYFRGTEGGGKNSERK